MKRFFLATLFIFLVGGIFASCSEEQIDINSASKAELDKLYGIGPVKAQAIIDSRPYVSIDDLTRAYGIGEATLNKIKTQGLACVEDESSKNEEDALEEEILTTEENETKTEIFENIASVETIKVENEVINLVPKSINTEENRKSLFKNNYAIYGFVGFSILLLFLFLIKGRKEKNEFD